jgi:hypothetical protein
MKMSLTDNNLSASISGSSMLRNDLIMMMTGDWIGGGAGRDVFAFGPNPSLVLKVEPNGGSFQNVMEWEVWCSVDEDSPEEKWLAPCLCISPSGRFLLQQRTQPLLKYPEKVPSFLADTKPENFGMYDGRCVAHDYGTTLNKPKSLSMRMVKAKWWSWQNGKQTLLST